MTHFDRRTWLKTMLAVAVSSLLPACRSSNSVSTATGLSEAAATVSESADSASWAEPNEALLSRWWLQADAIVASIAKVRIPSTVFPVAASTLAPSASAQAQAQDPETAAALAAARANRQRLQQAIDACHQQGGGTVALPTGHLWTGALTLRSRVHLQVPTGCYLQFHPALELYLPLVPTRWEGMELMGYQPLLYAYDCEDVRVSGGGVIDGGGSIAHWWPWKGKWKHTPWRVDPSREQQTGRDALMQMVEQGLPLAERVLTENFLRPPLWQPYRSQRVAIDGLTLLNSPFWVMNPVLCEDVTVQQIKVHSHGPNSDGCDPESCRRVLIEGCVFDTGDDCIALKSGRNADGRRLATPIEQVVIQHCEMRAGHGGVVIGSEISGGARQIFARDLRMSSPDLERGIRIKTNAMRGGRIDTIGVRDVQIGQVDTALVIDYAYEEGRNGEFLPDTGPVWLHNIQIAQAKQAFAVRGFADAPVHQLWLTDVDFGNAKPGVLSHVRQFHATGVRRLGQPWQPQVQ